MTETSESGFTKGPSFSYSNRIITSIAWSGSDGNTLNFSSQSRKNRDFRVHVLDLSKNHSAMKQLLLRDATVIGWSGIQRTKFAYAQYDHTIKSRYFFDGPQEEFSGHAERINHICWSPHGEIFASAGEYTIKIWPESELVNKFYEVVTKPITCISWKSDSQFLAIATTDGIVRILDIRTGKLVNRFDAHYGSVNDIKWLYTDEKVYLVTASEDRSIRIWDTSEGRLHNEIEQHFEGISSIDISSDQKFLASVDNNGQLYIWSCDSWNIVEVISVEASDRRDKIKLKFNQNGSKLAVIHNSGLRLSVFDLNTKYLKRTKKNYRSVKYSSAKIVIVGDRQTGKSTLAKALQLQDEYSKSQEDEKSSNTSPSILLAFQTQELKQHEGILREIFVWDLPPSPFYEILYPLIMSDSAVTIIAYTFDNQRFSESIANWSSLTFLANRVGRYGNKYAKVIVAITMIDKYIPLMNEEEISQTISELNIHQCFQIKSDYSKDNSDLRRLKSYLVRNVNWEAFPVVISPWYINNVRQYISKIHLIHPVISISELYFNYIDWVSQNPDTENFDRSSLNNKEQFLKVIELLALRGTVILIGDSDQILLNPTLLERCAVAIITTAYRYRNTGQIPEVPVKELTNKHTSEVFKSETLSSLSDKQKQLLIISTCQDLLAKDLAILEDNKLIFTSEFNGDDPRQYRYITEFARRIEFEGPAHNIYVRIIVRLSKSGVLERHRLVKDGAIFTDKNNGEYRIKFTKSRVSGEMIFSSYGCDRRKNYIIFSLIKLFIEESAFPGSVRESSVTLCHNCDKIIDEGYIGHMRAENLSVIICPSCKVEVNLWSTLAILNVQPNVARIIRTIDWNTNQKSNEATILIKRMEDIYDYAIGYIDKDRANVDSKIIDPLKRFNLNSLPISNQTEMQNWLFQIKTTYKYISSLILVFESDFLNVWDESQIDVLVNECLQSGIVAIFVLLPDVINWPLALYEKYNKRGLQLFSLDSSIPDSIKVLANSITRLKLI